MKEAFPMPTRFHLDEHEPGRRATVIVEPLFPGYGTTVGNALRRVLFSSLPAYAVSHIKIDGISHEFSTIAGGKEDIVQIILQVKQLRVGVYGLEEPVVLRIQQQGPKTVTAGDIEPMAGVEILNPDLVITTLSDAKSTLNMELTVSSGRGFYTTEARGKERLDVGVIAVDAIFTPVRNVGFRVEHVRVGQMTNYERLILDIETDGRVTPQQALDESTKLLIAHFAFMLSHGASSDIQSLGNEAEANTDVSNEAEIAEETETKLEDDSAEESTKSKKAKKK